MLPAIVVAKQRPKCGVQKLSVIIRFTLIKFPLFMSSGERTGAKKAVAVLHQRRPVGWVGGCFAGRTFALFAYTHWINFNTGRP